MANPYQQQYDDAVAFFGKGHRQSFRVRPRGPRPICACCGKGFGRRVKQLMTHKFATGTPIEPYQGEGFLLSERLSVGTGWGPDYKSGATVWREIWDGVSYKSHHGTDPFCRPECGAKFAQMAYKAGYRLRNRRVRRIVR